MNELKPEDVMKALDCCAEDTSEACLKCVFGLTPPYPVCKTMVAKQALALLREKDAQISALQYQADFWDKHAKVLDETISIQQKEIAEKDALIEDYRQELGRARVALNDANAEIERLHRVSAETSDRNFRILEATKKSCEARINLAIREAITEFAQRLKARYITLPHYCDTTKEVLAIVNGSIDQIAKEMKGDQDA